MGYEDELRMASSFQLSAVHKIHSGKPAYKIKTGMGRNKFKLPAFFINNDNIIFIIQ